MFLVFTRFAVFAAFEIGGFFFFKTTLKKTRTTAVFLSFVMSVALICMLTLFPFENSFATFSSPENAFRYSNFGTIQQVVAGQKSDFVVARNGEKSIYAIFPKTDKGWKLSRWLDLELTTSVITEETTVSVYRYKNTEDYYVTVFGNNGGVLSVSDSRNSEFVSLACANAALNQTFYTYYAYAFALDNYYVLTVNNKPIQPCS